MTTQFIELETINDQELLNATGGGITADITNTLFGLVPYAGSANNISDLAGGPTVGSLVEGIFS